MTSSAKALSPVWLFQRKNGRKPKKERIENEGGKSVVFYEIRIRQGNVFLKALLLYMSRSFYLLPILASAEEERKQPSQERRGPSQPSREEPGHSAQY